MSVGCVEPGIWRLFQNAAGENPQNSVRAREIRRNNMVRLTLAARRLVLVMAKNSLYASYTFTLIRNGINFMSIAKLLLITSATISLVGCASWPYPPMPPATSTNSSTGSSTGRSTVNAGITERQVTKDNKKKLLNLRKGMSRLEVLNTMGTKNITSKDRRGGHSNKIIQKEFKNPHRTSSYSSNGHNFEIFHYYTDFIKNNGEVDEIELTPIVLIDGVLQGWGLQYWDKTIKTHGLPVSIFP